MRVGFCKWVPAGLALLLFLLLGSSALAQDPNACDVSGEAPDVIVGDLQEVQRYGSAGGITAFSVGTVSCNIGSCWLKWISSTNEHPVIGQNMYRLKDGRYEQIGQSWLKHGFFALSQELCTTGCISTNGSHLGVNCSDPYTAGLNGSQGNLGPKYEVDPSTGVYPYPFDTINQTGGVLYKRLQVHNVDLDPALNAGALYFVEGQYVTEDDAAGGNNHNNASYREVIVSDSGGQFDISLTGETQRELAGVQAWARYEEGVKEAIIAVPDDGRFILAAKPTDLGGGMWHYEYAVQNLNSNRAARAFRVPVPAGALVENIEFHDVDYHSGVPYDGTDWIGVHDQTHNQIVWSTQSFDENPNANALRWGTLYTFRFDAAAAPAFAAVTVDLFLPGATSEATGFTFAPNICNDDGICDAGETCSNCAADCINQGPSIGECGDGVCEPTIGEDCLSCSQDCAGQQSGSPGNRYCCGDGAGDTPVDCSDARCNAGGFVCGTTGADVCCGDGACDPGEDSCLCAADCGPPPSFEPVCDNGIDEDCDGQTDCLDLDCCTDVVCADGIDADGDGVAECDCDDNNNQIWAVPGDITGLTLDENGGTTDLSWNPPLNYGGVSVEYDTVRSSFAFDFVNTASCLLQPDPTQPVGQDGEVPATNRLYNYLIRATNACPGGDGSLGSDSDSQERPGKTCP